MPLKVVYTIRHPNFEVASALAENDIALEVIHVPMHDREGLLAACRGADAVAAAGEHPFDRQVLAQLPRLRAVIAIGVGYDGFDLEAATEFGVIMGSNPTYHVEELSAHAFALMLACARQLLPLDRAVRAGRWTTIVDKDITDNILWTVRRPSLTTLGIVGYGNTGRAMARKARAFDMRVIACTKYPDGPRADGVEVVAIDELCRQSDFISVHAALNKNTEGIIGREQLRLMKPTAFLINTSRGRVIDEAALVEALSNRWIAGAGLDVMTVQPLPMDSPLLSLDNVLLTPHIASYSPEAIRSVQVVPCEEAARVLTGHWPRSILNPKVKENYVKCWGPMRDPEW